MAPVSAVVSVTLVDAGGGAVAVDPGRVRLVRGHASPEAGRRSGAALPVIPSEGRVEIVFDAGLRSGLGGRAGRSAAGGDAAGGGVL